MGKALILGLLKSFVIAVRMLRSTLYYSTQFEPKKIESLFRWDIFQKSIKKQHWKTQTLQKLAHILHKQIITMRDRVFTNKCIASVLGISGIFITLCVFGISNHPLSPYRAHFGCSWVYINQSLIHSTRMLPSDSRMIEHIVRTFVDPFRWFTFFWSKQQ